MAHDIMFTMVSYFFRIQKGIAPNSFPASQYGANFELLTQTEFIVSLQFPLKYENNSKEIIYLT